MTSESADALRGNVECVPADMLYLYDTPPETRVSGQGTWQRERSGGGWVVATSGVYSTDPGSTHTLSYVVRERGGELLLCIESDEGSRCFLRDP